VLSAPGLAGSREHFARIGGWLARGLARAGMPGVRREGTSDLVQGGRKVGGACIWRTRGLLHYGVSLLLDPDLALIERYLRYPPREPDHRAGRSHRDFLGALAPSCGPEGVRARARALEAALDPGELATPR
jgi:lipoate---protein ligase